MAALQSEISWGASISPAKSTCTVGYYSTFEESPKSTGIQAFPIEHLLFNCSSGSKRGMTFDVFKDYIREYVLSQYWKVPYLAFEETKKEAAPATIAEKLDLIRSAFGLSMSALAKVLRSSRASIYNWYETEPRSDEVLHRIDTLNDIALQWKKMNPYHYAPGKLMKQQLADGPSLLERFSQEKLDRESIQQGLEGMLVLMKKQRARMDRAKARSAKVSAEDESHRELLERLTGSTTANE